MREYGNAHELLTTVETEALARGRVRATVGAPGTGHGAWEGAAGCDGRRGGFSRTQPKVRYLLSGRQRVGSSISVAGRRAGREVAGDADGLARTAVLLGRGGLGEGLASGADDDLIGRVALQRIALRIRGRSDRCPASPRRAGPRPRSPS